MGSSPDWILDFDETAVACYFCNPKQKVIILGPDAGLSSLIHELLHWFFELIHFRYGHSIIHFFSNGKCGVIN